MDVQNLRIALFDALNPYGDEEGHDIRMNQRKHADVWNIPHCILAILIPQASFRELSLSDCCGSFLTSLGCRCSQWLWVCCCPRLCRALQSGTRPKEKLHLHLGKVLQERERREFVLCCSVVQHFLGKESFNHH